MVEYDVVLAVLSTAHCIGVARVFVAQPHSHIPYYHFAGVYRDGAVFYADTVAGRRLSGYCYAVVVDAQRRLERYCTAYCEDYRSCACLFDRVAQAPRSGIVEISDRNDTSSASALRMFAVTLSSGECDWLCENKHGLYETGHD
jgi:hypothetical protein